jgi:hypothetical protein
MLLDIRTENEIMQEVFFKHCFSSPSAYKKYRQAFNLICIQQVSFHLSLFFT